MIVFTWVIQQFMKVVTSLDSVQTPFGFSLWWLFASLVIFGLMFTFINKLSFTLASKMPSYARGDKVKRPKYRKDGKYD